MNGQDYRTTTDLTDADGHVLAATGDTCNAVPSESLGWLIEQGVIVPVNTAAAEVAPARVEPAVNPDTDDAADDTDDEDEE